MSQACSKPKVAVLHTSLVFITVEQVINDLLTELLPDTHVMHFVDSDVLATVVREGEISAASVARMGHLAQAAEAAGADVAFSVCSSLGPSMIQARRQVGIPIVQIDEAMASEAVRRGPRVGVLATVSSTLGPTADLVTAKAAEAGTDVSVRKHLVEGAFDLLMQQKREEHDTAVAEAARVLAGDVDVIVLAQASMSRLERRLADETARPVLSSPRLGVEMLKTTLHERAG
jgi:Asp/Glu/hydantoin racemase